MLLLLPPEIREKIYVLVCTSELSSIPLGVAGAHSSFPSNLLLTSSMIYHEVRPFYFTVNTFAVVIRRLNQDWDYFLSPPFLDYRREVRSLIVTFVRWGTKNFFQETLIPALEDCILNGRLRRLEIRGEAFLYYITISFNTEAGTLGAITIVLRMTKEPQLFLKQLLGPLLSLRHPQITLLIRRPVSNKWLSQQTSSLKHHRGETLTLLEKVVTDPYLERAIFKAGNLSDFGENCDGNNGTHLEDVTARLFSSGLNQAGKKSSFGY